MSGILTKQDIKFVETFVETGNGTKAVQKAYKVKDPNYAGVKAHDLLRKPKIERAIAEAIPDDVLAQKHIELFDQKRVDYFVFPKGMTDEEIVGHVNSVGIKVITVRESDKGKMAFYSVPDANAIKNALEMAYKIKGTYAPEKSLNINVEVESDEVVRALTDKLNGVYKGTGSTSDGGSSVVVDTETQD